MVPIKNSCLRPSKYLQAQQYVFNHNVENVYHVNYEIITKSLWPRKKCPLPMMQDFKDQMEAD